MQNHVDNIIYIKQFRNSFIQYIKIMKNRNIVHARTEARIYQDYYKPSLNIFRFLKSVLIVFISGTSPTAGTSLRRK